MLRATLAVVLAVGLAAHARAQTTYHVDVSNTSASDLNVGSTSAPWKNLNFALGPSSGIQAGDTLRIRSGNYDADSGTDSDTVTFPIELPAGVNVIGVNSSDGAPSLSERPRIGGEAAGSATHLFSVTATTGDKTTGTISRLTFVGENEAGLDAPIALMVVAENDYIANVTFEDNVCQRPHMNDTGSDGLATIHLECDAGRVTGEISNNVIETSNRGGIEAVALQYPGAISGSRIDPLINSNSFANPGGSYSAFAFQWRAPDLNGGGILSGGPSLTNNTINSRGSNIQNGIVYHADEDTQGGTGWGITSNVVDGCNLAGIAIRADGDAKSSGPDSVPELVIDITRNVVLNSGESGIRVVWDERDQANDNGLGYLHVSIWGNLIADSGDYGIEVHNFTDDSMGGVISESNTIVHNGLGGIHYANLSWAGPPTAPVAITGFANEVMYFNNPDGYGGYGAQVIGLSSTELTAVEALVTYSNWQGLSPCSSSPCTNIDQDPKLSQDANGWYHLRSSSPCIDTGWNGINLTVDIDGQSRFGQDGNCDGTPQIDMGADEFPENCP